jgi:citrate lyase beta subunit
MSDAPVNRRSVMVLPALAPERIAEAQAAGPDIVVIDLEDGTAADRKDEARAAVRTLFEAPAQGASRRYLRINPPATPAGVRDLASLLDWTAPPDGVVIPKTENGQEIAWVAATVGAVHGPVDLMPIVESPAGLEAAYTIAAAPMVKAVLLGLDDLTGDLGADRAWESLAYARGRVAAAAAAAGVEAIDGPWRDPDDEAGLIAETRWVAGMGFAGKACYHAGQIPHIHAAFTPSASAIAEAREIVATAAADDVGLAFAKGRVVNRSAVKGAERVLALARRRGVI